MLWATLVENMIGVSMPSRTYNILAAGKPILAVTEGGSELAQVVVEEDVVALGREREPDLLGGGTILGGVAQENLQCVG